LDGIPPSEPLLWQSNKHICNPPIQLKMGQYILS
jgi:hypothetical protein